MTKYKLVKGNASIDFLSLEAVAQFKSVNPDWADIEPVAYTEEPEPVVPVVPEQVTLWQFKQACAETNSPLPMFANIELLIDYLISQMAEGVAKQRAKRAWESANNIRRDSPTIEELRLTINEVANAEVFTVADVDNLFIYSSTIDA
jgi:hypothetical protein